MHDHTLVLLSLFSFCLVLGMKLFEFCLEKLDLMFEFFIFNAEIRINLFQLFLPSFALFKSLACLLVKLLFNPEIICDFKHFV